MTPANLEKIRLHAESVFPNECCGLLYVKRGREYYEPCKNLYEPCKNIADDGLYFMIDPQDSSRVDDMGTITCVVHSHCYKNALPTQADLVGCEASGLPWLIYALPTHQVHEFLPSGYKAPLVGRNFCHGLLDCYSLVRDYYAEIGIVIDDYRRDFEWWLKDQNLYIENFKSQGFVEVDRETIRTHDAVLMRIGSPVPNHAAVYLGDGVILQHLSNRLSSRDVYGGWFDKVTTHVLRHKSLC